MTEIEPIIPLPKPTPKRLTAVQARALAVELLRAADAAEYRVPGDMMMDTPIHDQLAREHFDRETAAVRALEKAQRHPRWTRFKAAFV